MFATTGIGAPIGAGLIGAGALFRSGGWALHAGSDGVGYMDKALDGLDAGFDFTDDLLGRAPEEEQKNTTFEFEMWGGEYVKNWMESDGVNKNKKKKKGTGKTLTLGNIFGLFTGSKKRLLRALPLEGRRQLLAELEQPTDEFLQGDYVEEAYPEMNEVSAESGGECPQKPNPEDRDYSFNGSRFTCGYSKREAQILLNTG
jgi:hypothetical protein